MQELLNSKANDFRLVADKKPIDPSIEPWHPNETAKFCSARCTTIIGPLMYQHGLAKLAVSSRLDCIIYLGNPYFLATWVSAVLARATGKRVLFWTHGWTRHEKGIKRHLRNLFYRIAHGLLLYGQHARAIGLNEGFPSSKLYVIYNSLDYPRQQELRGKIPDEERSKVRRQLFGASEAPMVIFSGRLTRECQLELLLGAMSILKCRGIDVNLLIVGDGPMRDNLEQAAESLGLSVRFEGACYDEAYLARLFVAADVTVSPGKVGLLAVHSLGYGTPVITHGDSEHQGPEWEAVIPGKTGALFERGDVRDLARTIEQWLDQNQDRKSVENECQKIMTRFYNPHVQRTVIEKAIAGQPADTVLEISHKHAETDTLVGEK